MNYEQKSTSSNQGHKYQEKTRLISSTTGVDDSEGQCLLTLYLYPRHLFYLTCSSSHLQGGSLSLKLLSLHYKLSKDCAL
jgi:hypothetical protein